MAARWETDWPPRAKLIKADDTVLSKVHSKEIDLVNYQYSGNAHDVLAGIGLINLLWHGCDSGASVPVDSVSYTHLTLPTNDQV